MNTNQYDIRFHHIGYACNNIAASKKFFLPFLQDDSEYLYEDIEQNVKVLFLHMIGNYKMELLEVLDKNRYCPIKKYIDKNKSGIHHICYEANIFEKTIINLKKNNFRLISKTNNGFEGRNISFFIPKNEPNGPLIEIVSKKEC